MHVHFIGIAGAGTSGLAELMLARGETVSGSDLQDSPKLRTLEKLGATVFVGHAASNVTDSVELVVFSSAVRGQKNPELLSAEANGIRTLRRAEFLAEVLADSKVIGVAGTHGKTTTTAMLSLILVEAGLDPTALVGASVVEFGDKNSRAGKGAYSVVEADEFDRSFLVLSPTVAVITNLEAEHLDVYKDLEDLKRTFVTFVNQGAQQPEGVAVVSIDDQNLRDLIPEIKKRVLTFGVSSSEAKYRAVNIAYSGLSSRCVVLRAGDHLLDLELSVPGVHNVKNALGAIAVADHLGVDVKWIGKALKKFKGVERRFQLIGEAEGITIVDDYAHHPTEIRATLSALAGAYPGRRRVAVFQPHTFTRTRDFFVDFATALAEGADEIFLLDVYPAREAPIEGVTSELIAEPLVRTHGDRLHKVSGIEGAANLIVPYLKTGDVVVTIGAGNVTGISSAIAESLRERDTKNSLRREAATKAVVSTKS